jgi:phage terminase small subunit
MAKHSISEASRLTGKARSTLHRHIKNGKLSKDIDADGQPVMDTAELVRVYGALQVLQDSDPGAIGQHATPPHDIPVAGVWKEVEALRQEKIERLEADLIDARKERDDWKEQAQRLSIERHSSSIEAQQNRTPKHSLIESVKQRVLGLTPWRDRQR